MDGGTEYIRSSSPEKSSPRSLFHGPVYDPSAREDSSPRRAKIRYACISIGILSVILVICSLFFPWYQIIYRDGPDSHNVVTTYETRYYFTGWRTNYPDAGNTNFHRWEEMQSKEHTGQLFTYFLMLEMIVILLVGVIVAGMLVAILKGKRVLATALGLAAALFLLLVPLFFMQELPFALNADGGGSSNVAPFWYIHDSPDHESGAPGGIHHRVTTLSPDLGWYMPVISAVLCLSAATLSSMERPRLSRRQYAKPVAIAVVAALLLVAALTVHYPRPLPAPPNPVSEFGLGLRINASANGDWQVYVMAGFGPANALILNVVVPSTGRNQIYAPISSGISDNLGFTWHDVDGDNRFDGGDIIILKGTINGRPNPCIQEGFRVQILYHKEIFSSSLILPPH